MEATLYTGVVSGYGVEESTKVDWALAQNSMDNLINIIQAESTLKRVSLRLFSRILVKGSPDKDNEGITAASYNYTYNHMKNSPDGKALIALIDRTSEDKTMENFQKYERQDKNNYIYGLFYFQHVYYSYQALKNIKVERKGSSDLLKVSYQSGDPGIAYNTIEILMKEFVNEYQALRYEGTDKVIEYSGECARLGIKVLPPDVNVSGGGFTADENGQIRFGLNAVKNVGRNLIENVVRERRNKPYTSLYDFCKRMHGNELNRRAVECLIKAGAFDRLGNNRHSHVEAVEGILKSIETDTRRNLDGQLDLFSVMSGGEQDAAQEDRYEIRQLPEYSHAELLQQEKEVSGLYLSGHPLDAYREKSARIGSHTIKDLTGEDAHVTDGERVRVVCAVVKNRMMTTKSNSMMAFTSVEDLTGTMEVIVFPKVLDTFRDAIRENAVVVIDGRLSVREDEASKLLADSIVPIDSYDPTRPQNGRPDPVKAAAKRLYIRLPSRSCPQYAKVINLLGIFDGNMPVILYLEDTKQKLAAPRHLYTSGHPLFFEELERLVGAENIATK